MKTNLFTNLTVAAALTLFLTPIKVFGGEVIVLWTTPAKYSDVLSGRDNLALKATLQDFGKHLTKLTKDLPQNQTLNIEVTDLDLAGNIQMSGLNRVRVYSDLYKPSMTFNYELVEGDLVVSSDTVVLTDANFLETTNRRHLRLDPLKYEKRMLTKWFNKTFE